MRQVAYLSLINTKNFHPSELRTGCEARVVHETRWVEAGPGATPHTVIFSLAPSKRQIQPWAGLLWEWDVEHDVLPVTV